MARKQAAPKTAPKKKATKKTITENPEKQNLLVNWDDSRMKIDENPSMEALENHR